MSDPASGRRVRNLPTRQAFGRDMRNRDGRMIGRALAVWFVLLVLAVAAAALREGFLTTLLGPWLLGRMQTT